MAMFECPGCNRIADDSIKKCPNCGYDIRKFVKAQKKSGKGGAEAQITLSSVYSANKGSASTANLPKLDFLNPEPVLDSPNLQKVEPAQEAPVLESPSLQKVAPAQETPVLESPSLQKVAPVQEAPVLESPSLQKVAPAQEAPVLESPSLQKVAPAQEAPVLESPSLQKVAEPVQEVVPVSVPNSLNNPASFAPAPPSGSAASGGATVFSAIPAPSFTPVTPNVEPVAAAPEEKSIFDSPSLNSSNNENGYKYGPINPPSNGRALDGSIQIPAPNYAAPERKPITPNAPVTPPTPVYNDVPEKPVVEQPVFDSPILNAQAKTILNGGTIGKPAAPEPAQPVFESPVLNNTSALVAPNATPKPVFESPMLNGGSALTQQAAPASQASVSSFTANDNQTRMGSFGMSTAATQAKVPASSIPQTSLPEQGTGELLFDSPELNARAKEIAEGRYVPTSVASQATLADANKVKLPTGNISYNSFGQAAQSSYKAPMNTQGGLYGTEVQKPNLTNVYSANPLLSGGSGSPATPPPNPVAMNMNPQGSLYGAQPSAPSAPAYGSFSNQSAGAANPLLGGGSALNAGNPLLGGGSGQQ